jgi:hypothetical protein
MVARYLSVEGIHITPQVTDAPLIVDANAVLAFLVALQRFQ